MSLMLMGVAFRARMGTHARKLVLLKLVDACRDDGTKIFPAVGAIADAAEVSERHVQRTLAEFKRVGLLRVVRKGGRAGPGLASATEYELSVDVLEGIARDGWLDAACLADNDPKRGDMASPLRGDMASPQDAVGVTPATERGDASVTLTLKRPLKAEREARGRGPEDQEGAGGQKSHRERGGFDEAGFAAMVAIWPRLTDDPVMSRAAWAALSQADRRDALAQAPAFLAAWKADGGKIVPGLPNYLSHRRWTVLGSGMPAATAARAAQAGRRIKFEKLTKLWWAVTYRRAETGGVTKVLFDPMGEPQDWGVDASEVDPAFVDSLKPYPVHGPELERWRPWFAARGVRLPAWRDWHGGWVFLPDHAPPGYGALRESDDDVAAAMGAG